jgi:nucleoside-diphosphate-sugar epimerase
MNARADVDRGRPEAQPADCSLVALTGATGFLGSHIADVLLQAGWRVRAAVRPSSDLRWLRSKPVEIVTASLADPDDARRLVAGSDAVIHCAGVVKAPDDNAYRAGNVATTERLLQAAAESGSPHTFVLISSLAAAGPAPIDAPRTEADPCTPLGAYGRSKRAAEQLLEDGAWPLRTVVLRPPALYGPRDHAFLPLLRAAQAGWALRLGSRMTGLSLVQGRDAAGAAVALLTSRNARGTYFVDDGSAPPNLAAPAPRRHACGYELAELTEVLAALLRRRIRTVAIPVGLLQTASRLAGSYLSARSPILNRDRIVDLTAPGWVCCGDKLQRDTGFTCSFGLYAGMQDTLASYRQNGWLT